MIPLELDGTNVFLQLGGLLRVELADDLDTSKRCALNKKKNRQCSSIGGQVRISQ